MLQLQVDGWRGTSSVQLLRLQAFQRRNAKEKVAGSARDYSEKVAVFQPHHPRTIFRGGAMQQHSNSSSLSHPQFAQACPARVKEMNSPSLEAQPTTCTKSVSSGF
jgi:hypothetical protein